MPQLTSNLFKQGPGESLADFPRHGDAPGRVRFTHIVHPYIDRVSSLNQEVQDLTFETIRIATEMASPRLAVRQVAVTLPGEEKLVPPGWIAAEPLHRTVLDVAKFRSPKPLPIVFDILDNGIEVPESPPALDGCCDYIIMTNSDIQVQPYFYLTLAELIGHGYDVITVNRRALPLYPPRMSELPALFAEHGIDHLGFDCFVFPRKLYAQFVKNEACVGIGGVMRGLLFNLAAHATRYLMLTSAHLTFHIGDERDRDSPFAAGYQPYNLRQSISVVTALAADPRCRERVLAFARANGERLELRWAVQKGAGMEGPVTAAFRRNALTRRAISMGRRVLKSLRRAWGGRH